MFWWTWLILALFVVCAVYFFWPRRNMSTKATESSQEVPAKSLGIQPRSKWNPIYPWVFIGGALLIFQLYVWIKWIAGPDFETVPAGASEPPLFMQISLVLPAG